MENPKFKNIGRRNRIIAITLAVTFHVAAIYGIASSTDNKWNDLIPDFVKEWVDDKADKKDKKSKDRA